MGINARCFDYGYNYCDDETYIYIADISDLLTCTTSDNV